MTPDPALMEALTKTCERFKVELHAALVRGRLERDDLTGVMVSSLMRAVDRIVALPDEPNDEELAVFQSSLLQVAVAAICLLDTLPFPALSVMVASFDTGKPQ